MNLSLDINFIGIMTASFLAGLILGFCYFMALWFTVWQLPERKNPVRLVIGSFVIRMTLILIGFYWITGHGHWERLMAAMLGFIMIRKLFLRYLGPHKAIQRVS